MPVGYYDINQQINRGILLNMRYQDIIRLCQVNHLFLVICEDDDFWRRMIERDFGPVRLQVGQTHHDRYVDLLRRREQV